MTAIILHTSNFTFGLFFNCSGHFAKTRQLVNKRMQNLGNAIRLNADGPSASAFANTQPVTQPVPLHHGEQSEVTLRTDKSQTA